MGVVAVAWFTVQATVDATELQRPVREVDVQVDPAALRDGFREGLQWFTLYRDDEKVGLVRDESRRVGAMYQRRTHTQIWTDGPQAPPTRIDLTVRLDNDFELVDFEARIDRSPLRIDAKGRRDAGQLRVEVDVDAAGHREPLQLNFPAEAAPRFDLSLRPLLMSGQLAARERFAFEVFDPMTMQTRRTVLEYLGRDTVMIMGREQNAHLIRQTLAGESLDSWVNDLGEVLREELPGSMVAVRESEAQALWGLPGRGAAQTNDPRAFDGHGATQAEPGTAQP